VQDALTIGAEGGVHALAEKADPDSGRVRLQQGEWFTRVTFPKALAEVVLGDNPFAVRTEPRMPQGGSVAHRVPERLAGGREPEGRCARSIGGEDAGVVGAELGVGDLAVDPKLWTAWRAGPGIVDAGGAVVRGGDDPLSIVAETDGDKLIVRLDHRGDGLTGRGVAEEATPVLARRRDESAIRRNIDAVQWGTVGREIHQHL
jgi:hypothetical protein